MMRFKQLILISMVFVLFFSVVGTVYAYHFDLFRQEEKLMTLEQHTKYRHFNHRVHVGDYPAFLLENHPDIYYFTFPYYRYLSSFGRDGRLPYVWMGGS